MFTEADIESQAWHEHNARVQYGRGVSSLAEELEQAADQARRHLADPRLAHDDLAAVRDRLVRACLSAGAVAVEAQQA